jgi:uncharacterized phage protein (TIGR01671 family)
MREIKFRTWDGKNKKMIYVDGDYNLVMKNNGLWSLHKGDVILDHNSVAVYGSGGFLMQYTGLKDKNGKEIYEGDLITGACHAKDELDIGIIEYQDAMFVVEYKGEEISESLFNNIYDCESDIEIIGNIHENPELLEN